MIFYNFNSCVCCTGSYSGTPGSGRGYFVRRQRISVSKPDRSDQSSRSCAAMLHTRLFITSYPTDEMAARFHHRLTWIHPFPNGNGRFSRTMADLLLVQNGIERFTWGAGNLAEAGDVRRRYIESLHAADKKDFAFLLNFVRSQ